MDQIRILITAMPRLLREIVETMVAAQPDMIVAGQVKRSESVAAAARRVRADIVVLGDSLREHGEVPRRMLNEDPRLKLLAVAGDGRQAMLYEMRLHQAVIDDVSPGSLADAIRAMIVD